MNFNIHFSNIDSNNYNIFNTINKQIINLIIINFILNEILIIINFINLYFRVVIDFDYFRYFFVNYSIFIIYKKIHSRFIKNINKN